MAEALAVLDKTGLKYRLGATGTEIEGPRDEVFARGAGEGELERKVNSAESPRSQLVG